MRQEELIGKAQTVLGLVEPDALGITLPHEHLLIDESVYFVEPRRASERKLAYEPIRLDNLYWIKTHWENHLNSLGLKDEKEVIKEAMLFKHCGGGTIVELTNIGLSRDPLGLTRISRATGLNIIMGSGYYIGGSHPLDLIDMSEEQIAKQIVQDILVGVDDTGVRAGIIGEIGCSAPLEDNESKVVRASAIAQRQTGAAINIHPGMTDDSVIEIVEILIDAGADLNRTVISHVDIWGYSMDTLRRLLENGCYIEYDSFGYEGLFRFHGHFLDMPTDIQRIKAVVNLIEEGHIKRILLSGDIDSQVTLVTYGGYGYAHIVRDIVPVMVDKGMTESQINTLLVENPKRLLTFVQAKTDKDGK